jgi:colicin import membrane protein
MNQLTVLQNLSPVEIFSAEKVDSILNKIAEEAKSVVHDVSTPNGRKEIASLAYKIAQSKTFMDDCGKKLGEDAKKTLDTINAERKKIRENLDALKEEVRKPLTEWEEAEEQRKNTHKAALVAIENESQEISRNWQMMEKSYIDGFLTGLDTEIDWQEFQQDATTVITAAKERTQIALTRKNEHEEKEAELQKLRAEKLEREQKEAEEKLKLEMKYRAEAEAKAKAEAEERAKREEKEREEKRIAREKQLAAEKEAAIKYEQEQSAKRLKEAEARAKKEKEEAVERERQRAENQKRQEAEAEAKRQANIKHKTKINNEILAALKVNGLDDETGKKIITAIVSGLIPHTKINY